MRRGLGNHGVGGYSFLHIKEWDGKKSKNKSSSIISRGLQNAERTESLSTDSLLVTTSLQIEVDFKSTMEMRGDFRNTREEIFSPSRNLHEVVVFVIFYQRQIPLFDIRSSST